MRRKKERIEAFEDVEKAFFEVDEERKTVRIPLHFETPEAIFDVNCLSRIPIFSDDFDEWLQASFDMIPDRFAIDLDLTFDDMQDYTEETLLEVFRKNILLSGRASVKALRERTRMAWALGGAGVIAFLSMVLIGHLWEAETLVHEMVFYFLDIATTVLFWEAAGILLVENREDRARYRGYVERFASIRFHAGEGTEKG